MSEKFDPYHKWLGIPPKDQPPNYYRLLGLDLFEDDSEIISSAAKRVAGYVQAAGKESHADIAQALLQRILRARKCLLDDKARIEYNAKLRGPIPVVPPPPPPLTPPPPPTSQPPPVGTKLSPQAEKIARAKPLAAVTAVPTGRSNAKEKLSTARTAEPGSSPNASKPPVAAAAAVAVVPKKHKRGKKVQPVWLMLGFCVAALVVVGSIVTYVMKNRPAEEVAKVSTAKPVAESVASAALKPSGAVDATTQSFAARDSAAARDGAPARKAKPTPELIQVVLNDGDVEQLKSVLAAGAKVDDVDQYGRTALRVAVVKDRPELVAALIEAKANVDLADDLGETPLMSAAQSGKLQLLDLLLDAGANVNAVTKLAGPDEGGLTALLIAARHGQAEVVETLLAKKAEVDKPNVSGVTPLMVAAAFGHSAIVEILIEGKANVGKRDRKGQTPIMYAAHGGVPEIVQSLIDYGAVCNAKTPDKVTALRIAAGHENSEVFDKLSAAAEKEAPELDDLPQ